MLYLPCPVKFVIWALFQTTQRQLALRAEVPFNIIPTEPALLVAVFTPLQYLK